MAMKIINEYKLARVLLLWERREELLFLRIMCTANENTFGWHKQLKLIEEPTPYLDNVLPC